MPTYLSTLAPLAPEFVLVGGAILLLMLGVFRKDNAWEATKIGWLAILVIIVAAVFLMLKPVENVSLFEGAFRADPFARFMKLVALGGAAGALLMSFDAMREGKYLKFEYPVLVLLAVAGMMMMISAVPFHMWTPDVYEGAPTPVAAFFAAAPKVAAMALFLRVAIGAFGGISPRWQQIVIFMSIASMALGSVAAIGQTNIKRLLAYSSIANMGFALVGLAAATPEGVQAVMLYMAIYMVMTLGAFACVLAMRTDKGPVEDIKDLAGLAQTQGGIAAAFLLILFSLAGVPPLAGFWGKYFVIQSAVSQGLWPLAVIAVISSVVAAFYYLAIIKTMFFQEPKGRFLPIQFGTATVLGISTLLILLAFLPFPLRIGSFGDWLYGAAGVAAKSLF